MTFCIFLPKQTKSNEVIILMNKRNPNWRPEELKLALLLYLSHDFNWLASMKDTTDEIVDLSRKLNKLPYFKLEDRGKNFRSPGSVRMKLTNFKALDERYGKSALSNCSKADRAIWEKYHNNKEALIQECEIINKLVNDENDDQKLETPSPYMTFSDFCKATIDEAQRYKSAAREKGESDEADLIKVVCSKMINASNLYLEEKTDYILEDSYIEHGGVNKATIQRKAKKKKAKEEKKIKAANKPIGKYVREEMQRLIAEGLINDEHVSCFLSEEWTRNTFHIGHPFFRKVSKTKPVKEQMRDKNRYIRYWKDEYIIGGEKYLICKEWYESNRKYFNKWLAELSGNRQSSRENTIKKIAEFLKKEDRRAVSIKRESIIDLFSEIEWIETFIVNMEKRGIILPFQGSHQQFVVEDYDALYEIAGNPRKYVSLTEE